MSGRQRKLFIALLVAALGIWLYNALLLVRPVPAGTTVSIRKNTKAVRAVAPFVYKDDIRDPFYCKTIMETTPAHNATSARKRQVNLPRCNITGIVYSAANPMAMLNIGGKTIMIRQGDVVDSMVVKKIEKDTVRIMFNGTLFSLGK